MHQRVNLDFPLPCATGGTKPRLGLPSDVDAITEVIIKTMPLDPQWDYRFPWRHEYPEDHYKYTRMLFEYFLDPEYDDWVVMVIEDSLDPGSDDKAIVAFGVWDVSYINKRLFPGHRTQDRKFLHPSLPHSELLFSRGVCEI